MREFRGGKIIRIGKVRANRLVWGFPTQGSSSEAVSASIEGGLREQRKTRKRRSGVEMSPRRLALRGRLPTRGGELESAPAPGTVTQPLQTHESDHAASLRDPAGPSPSVPKPGPRRSQRGRVVCFHQRRAPCRSPPNPVRPQRPSRERASPPGLSPGCAQAPTVHSCKSSLRGFLSEENPD